MSQSPAVERSDAHARSREAAERRLEALRNPRGAVGAADLVLVQVDVPAVSPEALLQQFPGHDCVLWAPPEGPSFAGIDTAHALRADGPERVAEILSGSAELWGKLDPAALERKGLGAPRLFGGFAFSARGTPKGDWSSFGGARFVLPRVTYAVEGGVALLTLAIARGELERGSLSPHVQLFEQAHEIACSPPPAAAGRDARAVSREEPAAPEFEARVTELVRRIAHGEMQKVVAAREVRLRFDQALDALATAVALRAQAPQCVRFVFNWGESAFLGATPERLLSKRGRWLETEALAGTIDAGAESPEVRLKASHKEIEEHQLVVAAIASALEQLCDEKSVPTVPSVRRLKHLLHLWTPIRARLNADRHVLDLLERLHPTPAVGGVPTAAALDWIEANEPFDRGWYSGAVGWFDARGDGEFNVALRSGLIRGVEARLYAGAGIVRESAAEAEYAETTLKLASLLGALRARS